MAQIELHPDFKDFLRLLNSLGVKYLVVGGYAVGYYGYPRATGDMWNSGDTMLNRDAEKVPHIIMMASRRPVVRPA